MYVLKNKVILALAHESLLNLKVKQELQLSDLSILFFPCNNRETRETG